MTQQSTILGAAVKLARKGGFNNMTKEVIAHEAGTATGSINYHFKTMVGLRSAVMVYAVEHEVLEVVAQGLVAKHPVALKAPEALKKQAARTLAS